MNRRTALVGAASIGVFATVPLISLAQPTSERLLEPMELPDKAFGADDAPVTVIEYASMTCGYCRMFHMDVWPAFKEKYVDTGKVRFIMREFPLDPRAAAAFMLARCAGDEKWYPTIDLLYRTQEDWARSSAGADALKAVMGMTGMNEASFEACLADEGAKAQIAAVAERARGFGVGSTPTFFVNGTMYAGLIPLGRFSEIVDPLITTDRD